MTRIEKQRLAKIRKEFAELKGAGCISVLMSFEDYLSWMDNINDEPVHDVNKTVEVVAALSTLSDYIVIGQLLQTIALPVTNNWFTRPFLQDSCYCAYGWDTSESNAAIDLCVEKGLFKLV
jgi:hypothetical protein